MNKLGIYIIIAWLLGICAVDAQAPGSDCNCPVGEANFSSNSYFKEFYFKFSISCLTQSFNINNVENTEIIAILKGVAQATGSAQQILIQIQQGGKSLLTLLKNSDAATKTRVQELVQQAGHEMKNAISVKLWGAHLACNFTQIAHQYYFAHPEDAPEAHRKFYKQKAKENLGPSASSVELPISPLMIGILAGVLLLSVILSVSIANSSARKRMEKQQIKPEELLQSPVLQELVKSYTMPLLSSLQAENKKLREQVQAQDEKIKDFKDVTKKLDQVIKQSGAIDVDKLQKVLSQLSKQVKDLEESPVRRENLRIVLQPEDFMNWLRSNPDIREAVKEGLDIVALRDTITKLLPHPLNIKDLGDLDKETIMRYWRIYSNSPEYLPAFKEQLLRELKNK